MTALELLARIGLPSAIVGMVLIAVVFFRTHGKVSTAAAIAAVCVAAAFSVIQLSAAGEYDVRISPPDVQGVGSQGRTTVFMYVSRGGDLVKTDSIPEPTPTALTDRLHSLGWFRRAELPSAPEQPIFWPTNRAFLGQTLVLGQTEYGALSIHVVQFTTGDSAIVTLQLAGYGRPRPERLTIRNKQLGVQTFEGTKDFFVAVREADMTGSNPWAAFSVFTTRG
jgi:hypothetical protein